VGRICTPTTFSCPRTGTNTGGFGDEVEVFEMETITPVSSVSAVKVWFYVDNFFCDGGGGNCDDILVSVFMGGAFQTDVVFDIPDAGGFVWKSAEFSGSWTQADLDALQVRFTWDDQGGGTNNDEIHIATTYAEITYTPPSPKLTQRGYIWEDDNDCDSGTCANGETGTANADENTQQAAGNTARSVAAGNTDVKKGERLTARIHIDNTGSGPLDSSINLALFYDRDSDNIWTKVEDKPVAAAGSGCGAGASANYGCTIAFDGVDTNDGIYTSIAFDPSGNPWVSLNDAGQDGTIVAKYVGSGGSGCGGSITDWDCTIAFDGADAADGQHTSIAFDPSGNAWVSLWDSIGGDTIVAQYVGSGGANCGAGASAVWDCTIAFDGADSNDGRYTSIAFDASGNPWVSLFDEATGDGHAVVAQYVGSGGANCGAGASAVWDCTIAFDGADTEDGHWTSIAFDPSGNAWVSLHDRAQGDTIVAKFVGSGGLNCGAAASIAWDCTIAFDGGNSADGRYTSIAFDPSGNAWVSLQDEATADGHTVVAKYVGSGGLNCGAGASAAWDCTIAFDGGTTDDGKWTSIAFDPSGNAWVSLWDNSGGTIVAKYVGSGGSGCGGSITDWDCATAFDDGKGDFTSIAFDSSGNAWVSLRDQATDDGHTVVARISRGGEIQISPGLAGDNGDTIAESHADMTSPTDTLNRDDVGAGDFGSDGLQDCLQTAGTWNNGKWFESEEGNGVSLPAGDVTLQCTEIAFMIDTSQAVEGRTYRFVVATKDNWRSDKGPWKGPASIVQYPTLTIEAASAVPKVRFGKDNTAIFPDCTNPDWGCAEVHDTPSLSVGHSLAFDPSGTPWLLFTEDNNSIWISRYVGLGGTGCTSSTLPGTWTCERIDDQTDQLFSGASSLAFDPEGNPWISYLRASASDDLWIARYVGTGGTGCTNATNSTQWTCEAVETTNEIIARAMAFDPGGNPWIVYVDTTNDNVKIARRVGSGGSCTNTAWQCSEINDVGTDALGMVSLAFDDGGGPWVSYGNDTTDNLHAAHYVGSGGNCTNAEWECWIVQTDSANPIGGGRDLAIHPDTGQPWIAYECTVTSALCLAQFNRGQAASGTCGADWICTTVMSVGGSGVWYRSIAFDPLGNAWIPFGGTDGTDDTLEIARYVGSGGSCDDTAWDCTTIQDPPTAGDDAGYFAVIAFDPSGTPWISHRNNLGGANGDPVITKLHLPPGGLSPDTKGILQGQDAASGDARYLLDKEGYTDTATSDTNLDEIAAGANERGLYTFAAKNTNVPAHRTVPPGEEVSATWTGQSSQALSNTNQVSIQTWKNDPTPVDAANWQEATSTAAWSARAQHASLVFNNKMWVIGGIASGTRKSDVWHSSDGITWTEATETAAWTGRNGLTSLVFNNKMWAMGGFDGVEDQDDVWSSADGLTWTLETGTAGWAGRLEHSSLVYDDKMWVLGGLAGSNTNDVWSSTDGATWTQATAAAAWSPRWGHTSLVYDNKMWVFGGNDGADSQCSGSRCRDVWYSANGTTWTQATDTAAWSDRYDHASVVFNNKMWVLGGFDSGGWQDDVWSSTDGVNWTEETNAAAWPDRAGNTLLVYDNTVWILGGNTAGGDVNDVWYTKETIGFTKVKDPASWSDREAHTSLVFDNKIWVMGGFDGTGNCNGSGSSYCKDVWYSTDGVTWTQAISAAAWDARYQHTSLVFNDGSGDKMWVIGGSNASASCNGSGSSRCRDVWHSTDGVSWMQVTDTAAWSSRNHHTSLVFDNKMWLMGGTDGVNKNDVWFSTDGITWIEATSSAAWSPRWNHSSLVFDNKMWVIGGDDSNVGGGCSSTNNRCNDAWYSTDGINWTLAVDPAPWSTRNAFPLLVFDNKMWVIGGFDANVAGCSSTTNSCNDIWYSTDGITWILAVDPASWSGRKESTSLVFDNKMWVIGGSDHDVAGGCSATRCNDVWSSVTGGWWETLDLRCAVDAPVGRCTALDTDFTLDGSITSQGPGLDGQGQDLITYYYNQELGDRWHIYWRVVGTSQSSSQTLRTDAFTWASGETTFWMSPEYTQSSYRWITAADNATGDAGLAAQDTATAQPGNGNDIRLRMLVHTINAAVPHTNAQILKLQMAQKSGTCDTGFVGEDYTTTPLTTTSSPFAFKDNTTPGDGDEALVNSDDPVHSPAHLTDRQTYEENNPAHARNGFGIGTDGLWDFSLRQTAVESNAYCFRLVRDDGTAAGVLFSAESGAYSVVPELTAAAGADLTWVTGAADFEIWNSSVLTWDNGALVCGATLTDDNAATVSCDSGALANSTTYRVQVVLNNTGSVTATMDSGDFVDHKAVVGGWGGTSPTIASAADCGFNDLDTGDSTPTCNVAFNVNDVRITVTAGSVSVNATTGTEGFMYLITTGSDVPTTNSTSFMDASIDSNVEDSSLITISGPATTLQQSAYQWLANTDDTTGGAALNGVAQDTAATGVAPGTDMRLRALVHVGNNQQGTATGLLKLQWSSMSGSCDAAGTGETYADVTSTGNIKYKVNTTPNDGDSVTNNAADPSHTGHTVVNQDYEEANNADVATAIPAGQDGKWDFALTVDAAAPAATSFCIRIVKASDSSLLDSTNDVVAEIKTNTDPDVPSALGPQLLVSGGYSGNTPTLNMSLSDPDTGQQVRYCIEIDDNADFSSPEVRHLSSLAAQGTASFTVGAGGGSGTGCTPAVNPATLADSSANGGYFWRVKTQDAAGAESALVTASAGAIAFIVDTTGVTRITRTFEQFLGASAAKITAAATPDFCKAFSISMPHSSPLLRSAILEVVGVAGNAAGDMTINLELRQGTVTDCTQNSEAGDYVTAGNPYVINANAGSTPFLLRYDAFHEGLCANCQTIRDITGIGTTNYTFHIDPAAGSPDISLASVTLILTYDHAQ